MKQTLLVIPHELLGIPVFGCGWLLITWLLWGTGTVAWLGRRQGWNRDTLSYLPMIAFGAAAITWLLPWLEATDAQGNPLGLAIRGYGVMFLIAVISGVGLTQQLARRAGLHPDIIFSMSFWSFVLGIIGARLFFVVQYWHDYYDPLHPPAWTTLISSVLKFTEGGLVVYGSLIGAMLAFLLIMQRHRLPKLATLDIFVPGLAIGLAFGRLGCLLNGCCWGGICEDDFSCIHFPRGAPAYMEQLNNGRLLGMEVSREETQSTRTVSGVVPGSLAAQKGIVVGDQIHRLDSLSGEQLRSPARSDTRIAVTLARHQKAVVHWTLNQLPEKSLGVVPTQLFSSINAALIALLAWSWYPARRRDGELVAGMFTVYPLTRFLLEIIRSDEPGRWGTGLTIAQWVSILILIVAGLLWVRILSRPAQLALPAPQSR
ncbi:MAG: prolipoprotein diacylglyceryl transferase [Pirellulaceae bacterium]|nr:prolipoprotein diacylglyceryl transferase [Pirellulaceae bacterium]